jgi:NADH-quinone oxidoreductase subunit C
MVDSLIAKFSGRISKLDLEPAQDAVLLEASAVREFFQHLRDDKEYNLDYLSSLSGVDAGDHLEVVYHISSTTTGKKLTVKISLPTDSPAIDTISDIYRAADWFEREIWELYGIDINGHPDLRLLLLPEDWDQGAPMRKGWTGKDFIVMPE